jgi:hypothetical protein
MLFAVTTVNVIITAACGKGSPFQRQTFVMAQLLDGRAGHFYCLAKIF